MLHYLLQILIFQVIFLALYDVFHKKDTFFTWNRLYLIITPILSLVLPFIKIDVFRTQTSQIYITKLERVITLSTENLVVLGTSGPEQNPINWWLVVYYTGAVVSLFLLILKLYKLKVLTSFSFKSTLRNQKIVTLPNSTQAFSFWNTIYLGDGLSEEEKKQILIHELVHVEQKHSLDQIWFEVLKVALWWNPLIYSSQSRITVLHEYLADAAVITTVDKRNYIEQLLNATFQTQEITFVNQFFNQSLIKKRILMLQKTKSKTIAKFKYLLLVPAIIGILTYTSCSDESNQLTTNKIENSSSPKNSNISEFSISGEPECPNQNASYDKNLDNYLKIRNGKNSKVIVDIVSIETSQKIRTVFIANNTTQYIRNIPEGKYRLNIDYGNDYAEKTVDGTCKAYFKNEKLTETSTQVLDFYTTTTKEGKNVPSYNLALDLGDSDDKDSIDTVDAIGQQSAATSNTQDAEPKCPNQNAKYDYKLDNYLRVTVGKSADAIIEIISQENSKNIRTAHIKSDQVYFVRNIPEGKYKLHITYGEGYTEKTVDGVCKGYFKNEKLTETGNDVLDFTLVKTDKGMNVPSYNITLDLTDEDLKDHDHS